MLSRYGDLTAGPLPRIAGLLAEAERTMLDPECAALNGHLRELSYAISGFKQRFPEHWPKKQPDLFTAENKRPASRAD